jgi:hypothetical protein
MAMGNNKNKQRQLGVFKAGPSNKAKVTKCQRVSHIWWKIAIESNTIIENVEECVLDRDIKKLTWATIQTIASNLAPLFSVVAREAMTQGVCTNLVVKYVVPNIIRFSKDTIVEGEFLFGLVQSSLKAKLQNTTHSKINYKACNLNSPC